MSWHHFLLLVRSNNKGSADNNVFVHSEVHNGLPKLWVLDATTISTMTPNTKTFSLIINIATLSIMTLSI
jgi:hypothetical protein